jgi:hypothetical protein
MSDIKEIVARIRAVHASQNTPIESFTDSRPDDLTDLCADLHITLEEAIAAQQWIGQMNWYAALDSVVEQLSDKFGADPIGKNYESGGHVAYAVWIDNDNELVISAILSDTIEGCDISAQRLGAHTDAKTVDDVIELMEYKPEV